MNTESKEEMDLAKRAEKSGQSVAALRAIAAHKPKPKRTEAADVSGVPKGNAGGGGRARQGAGPESDPGV